MLGCLKTRISEAARYSILFHPDEERIPEGQGIQKREEKNDTQSGNNRRSNKRKNEG